MNHSHHQHMNHPVSNVTSPSINNITTASPIANEHSHHNHHSHDHSATSHEGIQLIIYLGYTMIMFSPYYEDVVPWRSRRNNLI